MGSVEQAPASPPVQTPQSPQSKGGNARTRKLSPERRQEIASQAAAVRWGKIVKHVPPVLSAPVAARAKHKKRRAPAREHQPLLRASSQRARYRHAAATSTPAVFGLALVAAENRLAEAIQERAYHANMGAALDAEIPSLVQTIAALKNTQNPQSPLSLARSSAARQIQTDLNLAGAGSDPAPVTRPGVTIPSRAQGAALAIDLGEPEDEDRFLREDPVVGGGQWHG